MCPVYDIQPDRAWRHLDFFQHKTFLHARFPGVDCPACGVKTVEPPWARLGTGFTLLFEALVLTLVQEMPVGAIARLVGEHDTRLWRVLQYYVEQARQREDMSNVRGLGVDETSSKRGNQYISLFADLDRAKVLFVTEGRDSGTVTAFREDFEKHHGQPENIETVCLDVSPAYQAGLFKEFRDARMVFDRFHVTKIVNHALDQIRRAEVKENEILKRTRYCWLKTPQNLTCRQRDRLDVLKQMNLATAQAYQMKLNLQELWTFPDRNTAAEFLERWYSWVIESKIGYAMKRAAKTIKEQAQGILNYFDDRVTNGLMEGINSLVQAAKSRARGYRNVRYLMTIIYLIAGKLDFSLPT